MTLGYIFFLIALYQVFSVCQGKGSKEINEAKGMAKDDFASGETDKEESDDDIGDNKGLSNKTQVTDDADASVPKYRVPKVSQNKFREYDPSDFTPNYSIIS